MVNLEISSLEELDKALIAMAEKRSPNGLSATLSLYGPQILVRQFEFPVMPRKNLKNALKLEAAEVFSLLPEEIEIDYQSSLYSSEDGLRGIFVAMPRKLLKDYISRLLKDKIRPEKITANICTRINYFLNHKQGEHKSFSVIDFFKTSIVNTSIFSQGNCELAREVYYENITDAEKEIIYSFKYTSSKCKGEKFTETFVIGDLSGKDELINNLQKNLNTDIKKIEEPLQLDIYLPNPLFKIDLLRRYTFQPALHKRVILAANLALLICALIFLIISAKMILKYASIHKIFQTFSMKDYEHFRSLKQKLKLLENAK